MKKTKAIGLISGGLDSILALKMMIDQGIDVLAFNMKTPFCNCDSQGKCYSQLAADKFGVPIKRMYVGEEFLQIVKNPKHGYGRHMNPCIDCRIFLFNKAKEIMEQEGADFVFTGEVLGERPMSQRKEAMEVIERESGLKGKVLRPLCAHALEPTPMEKEGRVDRNRLLDIRGRSRKPQLDLARKYELDEFPNPAGGCLLTDENFALKIKDAFEHGEDSIRHIGLLKIGRHFRLSNGTKIIAGRDQQENEALMAWALPSEPKFTVHGYKSTYALLLGEPHLENQNWAARICARYCDREGAINVLVKVWFDSSSRFKLIEAEPLGDFSLASIRIGG